MEKLDDLLKQLEQKFGEAETVLEELQTKCSSCNKCTGAMFGDDECNSCKGGMFG
ncbi:hypothetical protein [Bacteroides cellulosilyticus]|uniref:hypothetical protein n=1 Tax=Bacteroides cellulosilyticus TaxID=246787 RepID=UPI001C37B58E|nr:hypothetical protein [Bacteroides cellulosilyticus]MBV3635739.1 hypothetical protein [Bacteroides cellulosilyticus]MBV3661134.1 hypothetical protein [Bacteroides cellulosilyticus]MBV3683256.1 hypothetical protein [Bacteroides cellulosilyticus]MBV3692826.1 hypothetical protein [Bacteroides cellulosilyticus]MBV3705568.1 hypothetical protein [Bacteroides cellulosilyticus]